MELTVRDAIEVKVREDYYSEFVASVRKHKINRERFKGKYIPKIYEVKDHICNHVRLAGLNGLYFHGYFSVMKAKEPTSLLDLSNRSFSALSYDEFTDSHKQNIYYTFLEDKKKHNWKNMIYELMCEENCMYYYKFSYKYNDSCFSGLGEGVRYAESNGATHLIGRFEINTYISYKNVNKFIKLCKKNNAITSDVKTAIDEDYESLFYCVPISKDYRRLYFTLNMLRMVAEYSGSINRMLFMLKECPKLNFYLAMHIALSHAREKRDIHLPYDPDCLHGSLHVARILYRATRPDYKWPEEYCATEWRTSSVLEKQMYEISSQESSVSDYDSDLMIKDIGRYNDYILQG